ncbi:beta-glucoside-specific PTS transporter subunit IIABC [Salinicoccus hispanicus]|uniref:PTS transporter subunit EIIC n=1 Tax=Salinicoccus hispanicus TaxID=157225 RepID=A0A6N8U133_9STAP|nr:beta-glucoside-specific PTS transporter subunit IIABC [Salinicoccus hispanicus]MXQ51047.1 PTS transporter subunit EIIC [Salinicoccus hispanicus]
MSGKVRDYPKLARDILDAVGGKENVSNVARCATRLRIVLKEDRPEAKKVVSEMPGVISVVERGGQFQVVIGQHVGEVYQAFLDLTDLDSNTQVEGEKPQGTIVNRVIATMSAVFAPFIYILAAAGILQGLLILINLVVPAFAETGTYEVFSLISWAPFVFLPILIAITASKHFRSNTYIAIAATGALVSPTLTELAGRVGEGETVSFIGFALSETTYTSTVLPALFLVWGLSYLERFLDRIMNETIRPLFTPFFALIIAVPLALLVIGPVTAAGANLIADGYNVLSNSFPALAGALIGAFWQVFVIFGVHWGITPMVLANYDQYGMDSFQAYQTIAVIAQVGAVLGVIIKTKRKEIKQVGTSAAVTGLFGITEPAIYGITLRFKKPFIIGSISGAIGCIVASFFNPYYFAYAGLPGPLTLVNAISSDYPSSIWGVLIGVAIAIVLPVILIQIFGYGDDTAKQAGSDELVEEQNETGDLETSAPTAKNVMNEENVLIPVKGSLVRLEDIPDQVFASGAMGKGVAIEPEDDKVTAPFEGEVTFIAPSKHAIGLRSMGGVEVLIHVGLDTVELDGKPFNIEVSVGDHVQAGDLLMAFDREMIDQKGLRALIPVIVTNTKDYADIVLSETIAADKIMLTIVK